ncbi:MAG: transcriptional repressor [Ruminococcaceae bacterium]|nr:transcriptional repressor [Oscillospiraceae bacterium]
MTKQRELIINILKQSDRHLTADEIFFLAKLKMPSIAMATIYNNLNAMNEAGLIKRLHIDGVADSLIRSPSRTTIFCVTDAVRSQTSGFPR